jgi:hypothetical protein
MLAPQIALLNEPLGGSLPNFVVIVWAVARGKGSSKNIQV